MREGLAKLFRFGISIISRKSKLLLATTTAIGGVVGALIQFPSFKIAGYRPEDEYLFWALIGCGVFNGAIGWVISTHNDHKIEDLKNDHQSQIKYYQDTTFQERTEALNDHLREIAERMESPFTMQERICVYTYSEENDVFHCAGRYSPHPDYTRNSARKQYPGNSGIIAAVWRDGQGNGFKQDNAIPDIKQGKGAYYSYLREIYSIQRDVAQKFRMHPVDIIAEVLRDSKNRSVAVIIFESQRKGFLRQDAISRSFDAAKRSMVLSCIEKLQDQSSPERSKAKEFDL